MPLYDYECPKCGVVADVYAKMDEREQACPHCATLMRRLVSTRYSVVRDMAPHYDDNLQSWVKSKQHRAELMRRKGLVEKYGKGWT